jgi:hypothetical protein
VALNVMAKIRPPGLPGVNIGRRLAGPKSSSPLGRVKLSVLRI